MMTEKSDSKIGEGFEQKIHTVQVCVYKYLNSKLK